MNTISNMMKSNALGFLIIIFLSCQNTTSTQDNTTATSVEKSAETATLPAGKDLETLNVAKGQLNWTASKIGGKHLGTVDVKSGTVTVLHNTLITGEFLIDMQSIKNIDLDGEQRSKLENHLRSEDFFGVEEYPEAKFLITEVVNGSETAMATHTITGDLQIRNITRSISFPANVSFVGDEILVSTPAFTIDRTLWRLKYRSKALGTAPDLIIDDDITLVIALEARKS